MLRSKRYKDEAKFLELLKNVYNLDSTKDDKELTDLLDTLIGKVEKGINSDIEIMRMAIFLNKYLFANPSKELIELGLFMQKKSNNYRGLISLTDWFF